MKKKIDDKNIILIIVTVVFAIIFFSYNIAMTWDSSEYLGLADYLFTDQMKTNWIGHRGMLYPLLIKIFQPLGIKNQFLLLLAMFISYIGLIYIIFKIIKRCKDNGIFDSRVTLIMSMIMTIFFIVLNPIIFGYYHTLLTEFVAITMTMLICYLAWKWLDVKWDSNKNQIVKYLVVFSCISIFVYHVKQSLYPIIISAISIAALLAVIKEFKLKNIVYRIVVILITIILLFSSIFTWGKIMGDANVIEKTESERISKKLIYGISKLEKIATNESINIDLNGINISLEDKEEINKVLKKESIYNEFTVYKDYKDEYFVFFSKDNYSMKEQIRFYLKIIIHSPYSIIDSYCYEYWRLIFMKEGASLGFSRENFYVALLTFRNTNNCTGPNPDYEIYIEPYSVEQGDNIVTTIYDYTYKLRFFMIGFTKINLFILPILILIVFISFIINLVKKKSTKILEILIILYGTAYMNLISYIAFGAYTIDRYSIPSFVPTYIADIILIGAIVKQIKNQKEYKL